MRIALVILPPVRAEAPLRADVFDALRACFTSSGFKVEEITTSPTLAADVDRATTSLTTGDTVLVHVAGATTLHDDGSLALRLEYDGDLALGFQALAAPFGRAKETLFVVDTVHDGFENDARRAVEHGDAAIRATGAGEGVSSLLMGVSSETREEAVRPWPLTRHLVTVLTTPSFREGDDASMARAFDLIRDIPDVRVEMPGLFYVAGPTPFVLDGLAQPKTSRPPGARSMLPVSLPALEPILAFAAKAREKNDWDEALDAYKKALMVVGQGDAAARASIYASIAEVKRAQGKTREAEMNFEKALGVLPGHRRSLDALIVMATAALDWRRVVEHRRRIVASRHDPARKAEELCTIATLLETELRDGRAAADALEQARELAPRDVNVLQRLRAIYESTQSWPKLVDLLGALCLEGSAPVARAELRFVQADVTLARIRDEPRGLELLEAALEEDPAHERSLTALVAVRTRREEWKELARTYARVADQCANEGLTDRAHDLCKRLAQLRRDRLRDGPGAIEAYRGALRCKPRDADVRAMIAELLLSKGEPDAALRELETASTHAPSRVATYRRLFEIHSRAGRTDNAWLAATALDELGAAEVDHDLLIDQFRPQGSMRAAKALDDRSWSHLCARGVDAGVSAVLRAVAPAAIALRVSELRAKRQLTVLDPHRKQAPSSTVSIVRTFAWASQVLSVEPPELFVLESVPGGLAAVQLAVPTTAIGPTVLRGMSVPTLAFLVARHLTYYRPEHYALVFFPSLSDLSTLVLSAIKVALPRVVMSNEVDAAARRLEAELDKQGQGAKDKLASAVRAMDEHNGKMDLGAWIRGVELTAHRAGLLLAGELAAIIPHMKSEARAIGELSLDDKRGDLLAFCVSRDMATLRGHLGIGARGSSPPPGMRASK